MTVRQSTTIRRREKRWWQAISAGLIAGTAQAQSLPFRQEQGLGTEVSTIVLAFLACVAVLALILWLLQRFFRTRTSVAAEMSHLRVISRTRLSAHAALAVVEFGGTRHLIAYGSERVVEITQPGRPGPHASLTETI